MPQRTSGLQVGGLSVASRCRIPVGTVFSAIFLRYISAGGSNLTGQTAFNEYVSQLIIAIIIYFAGFSKFIKDVVIDKWLAGRKKKHEASSADAKPGDGGKEV